MDKSAKELIEKIAFGFVSGRGMFPQSRPSKADVRSARRLGRVEGGVLAGSGGLLAGTAGGYALAKKHDGKKKEEKDEPKKDDEKKEAQLELIQKIAGKHGNSKPGGHPGIRAGQARMAQRALAQKVGKGLLAAGGTAGALYGAYRGARGAYEQSKKRDEEKKDDEKKEAQLELIQKIAISPEIVGRAHAIRYEQAPKKGRAQMAQLPKRQANLYDNAYRRMTSEQQNKADDSFGETQDLLHQKQSSMKNIIDDIIKGAKDNSFGRPVHIQNDTQDWTPLAISKTAGMLMALEQQGYSVKQAAEYLGLTVSQVQDIVATVR